jgi:hypothetical protein
MDARDLLGNQREREKTEAIAAAVFGNRRAVKTERAHLGDEVSAESVLAVVGGGGRRDFLCCEIAREVAHRDQLFGKFEIHFPSGNVEFLVLNDEFQFTIQN